MKNAINHFMGASVLAGLMTIGSGAIAQADRVETGAKSLFPESSNSEPDTTLAPRRNEAEQIQLSKEEEKFIVKKAFNLIRYSQILVEYAQKGAINNETCELINSDLALKTPKDLREDFKVSVETQQDLGALTKADAKERITEFDKVVKKLEDNNNAIRQHCPALGLTI